MSPKTTKARTTSKRMTAPKEGVKVRMYRTGLGDCFLMAFPKAGGAKGEVFYLMIDCGVYAGTPEPDNKTRIRRIVEDIRDATGGRLDVLAVTHEHWDHCSAFHPSQAQEIFGEQIDLGALWLAWTENLSIPLARDLHEGRKAARVALAQALSSLQGLAAQESTAALVGKMLDFFGGPVDPPPAGVAGSVGAGGSVGATAAFGAASLGARKSVKTEEAMEWLRDCYGKDKAGKDRKRFLSPGESVPLEGARDVRVYVLGPPEDSVLIKRSDPTGEEVYPKAMEMAIEASFFAACGVMPSRAVAPSPEDLREARRLSLPFDEAYRLERDTVKQAVDGAPGIVPGFPTPPGLSLFRTYFEKEQDWRRIDGDWLEAAGEFALQLDNATNNTSLALAIEIGPPGEGKVLLFPGDAQVGNWRSWFGKVTLGQNVLGKEMVWKVGDRGEERTVTAEDLLRRTVLYKVGHHGSHNATLREQGLELMGRADGSAELVAFLPVDEHIARDKAHYGEMPLRSLVKELAIRTGGRIVRSDEGAAPGGADSTLAPIEGAPPILPSKEFMDVSTELYFEYTVTPP